MRRIYTWILTKFLRRSTEKPAPFVKKPKRKLRLEQVEDRNAPGNLLGGLVGAALGGVMNDPIDAMATAVGDTAMIQASSRATAGTTDTNSDYFPSQYGDGGSTDTSVLGEENPSSKQPAVASNKNDSAPVYGSYSGSSAEELTLDDITPSVPQGNSEPWSSSGGGDAGGTGSQADNRQDLAGYNPVTMSENPYGFTDESENQSDNRWVDKAYASATMAFEKNNGQTDSQVSYYSRGHGYTLYLTSTEAVLVLNHGTESSDTKTNTSQSVLRMQLVDSNSNASATASNQLSSSANYYKGESSTWESDVEEYSTVTYSNVYEGISLIYYGTNSDLEYDFVVSEGADLSKVKFRIDGAKSVSVDESGNLVITTDAGTVTQEAPKLYQKDASGNKQSVGGRYKVHADGSIGFEADAYDTNKVLYVDPVVKYGTAIGGSDDDNGYAVAVDASGQAYITGQTMSVDFPVDSGTLQGTSDAFVVKLSADGTTRMYACYIGGSGNEMGCSIAVDSSGNAYVLGMTNSSDFATTTGAYKTTLLGGYEYFVVKLNATGSAMVYSTLLDGTTSGTAWFMDSQSCGIAIDKHGKAYITGTTPNTSFPTTSGAYQTSHNGGNDAFLVKLNETGTGVDFSTFVGGSMSESAYGIALDRDGNIYLTGGTNSDDGPFGSKLGSGSAMLQDAFVVKFSNSGSLVYGTRIGGTSLDVGHAITVDASGNAFVTGETYSSDFPTTTGPGLTGITDAFVLKLNAAGTALDWSRYYGGTYAWTRGTGIQLDGDGNVWVAGSSNATDLTTVNPTQSANAGGTDGFLLELNASGTTILFATYLGGTGTDDATGLAIDVEGNLYVEGTTSSSDFPIARSTYDNDAFVVKYADKPNAPTVTAVSDDTGWTTTDGITNDQTLNIIGTAIASSTVDVYLRGTKVGTTTANSSGAWTFNYTGTTLAEGVYGITATATVSSKTSDHSDVYYVTVDTTGAAVIVTMDSNVHTLSPYVHITVSDDIGVADGSPIYIDVDLNNDGDFTDTGETNYTSSTITDYHADIYLPVLAGLGTYKIRARVVDTAGNTTTSSTQDFTVVSTSWGITNNYGTDHGYRQYDSYAGVSKSHGVDTDTGSSSGASLVYDSQSVDKRPIIQAKVQTSNTSSLPSTIRVELFWNGTSQGYTDYSTAGYTEGDVITVAAQVNSTVTGTGRHTYELRISFPGTSISNLSVTGAYYVASLDDSVFGSGWGFSGVDRLYSISASGSYPAGILRVSASGSAEFYASNGSGGYTSPQGDNGTLAVNGSGWRYTTPSGQVTDYNSAGMMTSSTSPDGLSVISATYTDADSDGQTDDISTYTEVDGTVTTFNYTSGKVTSITTPNGSSSVRTVTLAYTGTNLTSITNPDSGVRTFGYDSNHRMTSESWDILSNSWTYGTDGVLRTETRGSGNEAGTYTYNAEILKGLGAMHRGEVWGTQTDPYDNVTQLRTDGKGRVMVSRNAFGKDTIYTRDSNGRVLTAKDELGRVTSYEYDSAGYVTKITNPDSTYKTFTYQTAFHAMLTETDERGKTTTYTYDSLGHVLTITNAEGEVATYTYYSSTGLLYEQYNDANQLVVRYTYDSLRRKTSVYYGNTTTESWTYDSNGNVATHTDQRSKVTSYTNDVMGRVTEVTSPTIGVSAKYTYNDAGMTTETEDAEGVKSRTFYDSRGQVIEVESAYNTVDISSVLYRYDEAGRQIGTRDANGNWSWVEYDADYNAIFTTDGAVEDAGERELSAFNAAGEKVADLDEKGNATKYQNNNRGWVTQITDSKGNIITRTYDAVGNLLTETDDLGHVTEYEYDDLNRQILVTNAENESTETVYNSEGQVWKTIDGVGRVTEYLYDILGRRTHVTEGKGSADERTMVTTFDAAGNVASQTDGINTTTYTYDDNNRKITETDALNHTTTMTYDDNGNVETVTDAEGKVTTYYYDGQYQQEKVVDANGNTTWSIKDAGGRDVVSIDGGGNLTQYGYDGEGRMARTVAPDGGVTLQWYDDANNRIAFIDPEGNITWYGYNELNQLVWETDQLGETKYYTYDDAGRLATLTDKLGRVQEYVYDNADRLLEVNWKNSSSGSIIETLEYTYYNDGKVHTAANSEGAYTFTYDDVGRIETQTDPFGNILTYTYNDANDRTQVSDSKGGTTNSTYDAAHRLTERTQTNSSGNGARVEFSYNNRNDRTEARRYDAASSGTKVSSTTYATDDGGRQTGQTHKDGSGTTLITFTNAYDSANRITSENRNSSVQNFTYDDNSQVTTDGSGNTYTTDKNGNRTMSGYSTGDANRLASDGIWEYTYDAEGNTTKKERISDGYTYTYGYDHRNQMVWVEERLTDGGTLVQREDVDYDVFGNVIRETLVVGSTTTITKRAYEITNTGSGYTKAVHIEWATMDASGNITLRYLAGDSEGEKFARFDSSGSESWILQDRLGSVRDLLNATGTVTKSVRFDGFGNILFETGSGTLGEYGFHGMRWDAASKTWIATRRRTDPETNRWTTVDPIGTAGGDANFYRMAGNNSANATDRNGLQEKKDAEEEYWKISYAKEMKLIDLEMAKKSQVEGKLTGSERIAVGNGTITIRAVGNAEIAVGLRRSLGMGRYEYPRTEYRKGMYIEVTGTNVDLSNFGFVQFFQFDFRKGTEFAQRTISVQSSEFYGIDRNESEFFFAAPGSVYLDTNGYDSLERDKILYPLSERGEKVLKMYDAPSFIKFPEKGLTQEIIRFETYIVDIKNKKLYYVVKWTLEPNEDRTGKFPSAATGEPTTTFSDFVQKAITNKGNFALGANRDGSLAYTKINPFDGRKKQ